MTWAAFQPWLVGLFALIGARVVNYPLAPIVALFADKDGWLPKWLWWFQTWDNSLDGDNGWRTEHAQWRFKFSPRVARWIGRTLWMYRNAMYGFAVDVVGAHTEPGDVLKVDGDLLTSDRPIHSGSVMRRVYRNGELKYWQIYIVIRWSKTRCIRILMGWKLWFFQEGKAVRCQLVFSPHPWHSLSET